MDPTIRFFCYLGAAVAFGLSALGGTRSGSGGQPAVLLPIGLLLWVLPALWDAGEAAF
jgi:hypothetical protein